MIDEYINKPGAGLFILLAPLDWGLGHATRCVPIIHSLLKQGADVILAAEGASATLLQEEFPKIEVLPLAGYRIRYGKSRYSFIARLVRQLPSIQSTIKQENRWLQDVIKSRKIDGVISDNRFGFYHRSVPSIYITHQLFIETGKSWLNRLAQRIHYSYIRRFSECWVPDHPDAAKNLAGKLSHPRISPKTPVKYLGPLSRFKDTGANKITYDLLILLSGPEPQRTLFETQILQQLKANTRSIVLVRGLPGKEIKPADLPNLVVYNHLPAEQLNSLIQQSEFVLARAGYSTIMDLAALKQKAILVPTPGQGEQEYLANYLHQQHFFYTCAQENFDLEKTLQDAATFSFVKNDLTNEINEEVIAGWLHSLKKAMVEQ